MRVHREGTLLDLRKVFTAPGVPRRLISAGAGLLGRIPVPKFMRRKLWGFSARRLGIDQEEVPGDPLDHFFVPFVVPDGTVEIEIRHDDLSAQNILDWGLVDETGTFRGWGGRQQRTRHRRDERGIP